MSAKQQEDIPGRQRCPNGERWNTKTKRCEKKKPKKYTFKRGQGQGQVILQRKEIISNDLQKDAQTIPEAISSLSQELTDVRPFVINPKKADSEADSESQENELTSIKPATVIPSNILDTITEATSPLEQHPIQIVKTKKRIKITNATKPLDDNTNYSKMSGKELRDIWASLMGLPLGQETSGKFGKKIDLIEEIIRLKRERENKPATTAEEDIVFGNEVSDPTIVIPEEPFQKELSPIEEKKEQEKEVPVINEPFQDESEPIINPIIEEPPMEDIPEEPENEEDKHKNKEMFEMEKKQYENAKTDDTYGFLYPEINDPNFNVKIAKRKEFNDTKYDGTVYDIKKQAELLCNADFELMPHQLFVKNFLSFQTPYNSLLLYNSLGTGKCHSKGTPIMLFDGSLKKVEDIQVGELLMGDDSLPRRVISLANGRDKMYDVVPIKGEKYTVNSEHILCLRASGFPKLCYNNRDMVTNYNVQWIENNKFMTKNFAFNKNNEEEMKKSAQDFYDNLLNNPATNDNIYELAINDYLKLPKHKKSILKGYKVPIDFPEKELQIDPYMIGYWLGDGSSRDAIISCQDSTVLHYFASNLPKYNASLNYRSQYDYGISGNGKHRNNLFLNELKDTKMINNKHIPMLYKCNSRENRLKLLAGLLDSDGSLSCNGFEFTQKNETLMDDVIFLARSLGFSCYKSVKKTSWTHNGIKMEGTAFRTNINGNGIEEIPTLIPRKKAYPRKQIKDVLVTGIKVEYVKEDEYYGFTLDGNCRYLMGDFTVTHNTCSAIGIAEEMRTYMKQIGISKKILVVASPNVQENFKMQLFDESKLKEENGLWNLNTCVGNSLLKEINPTNLKGIPREKIISQINSIRNSFYSFFGYTELANYITKKTSVSDESGLSEHEKRSYEIKKIRKVFNNSLIIVDEVHNLRITDDNKNKRTATLLMKVAKYANNLRFLLLSATPMYNSYKEILWLLNLMNINDNRSTISEDDIFDKEGNFIKESSEAGNVKEGGRELLQRKLIGYISYVRGENPYTFPFRIYPDLFSPENLIKTENYPKFQMNKKPIETPIQYVPVFVSKIGEYQQKGYNFIMENMRKRSFNKSNSYGDETVMPSFENMEKFGYTLLEVPLEALNIVYPNNQFDDFLTRNAVQEIPYNQEEYTEIITNVIGKRGLSNIMNYDTIKSPQPMRFNFDYKPEILASHGKIFSKENISKYSNKIGKVCDSVLKSKGIIIVYSQYIDGGCVPIALALEELGFSRYGSDPSTKSLLRNPPEPIDSITLKPKSQYTKDFKPARYVMITGDPNFSPNNANDIKFITKRENKNGELVKVIIISKAASEGLDFKNIRQVHIMEPWYNMNRIEQIIGRGVRNLSHCGLPFEDRNVEIYLHGTLPSNDEEPADLYVYRLAEKKALQIGKVTRVLKESAVDCLLNIGQTNFTVDKLMALAENSNIKINLSSKTEPIEFKFGDKDFTDVCDYMECQKDFKCSPYTEISEEEIIKDTYSEEYVKMNYPMILKRIRQLFKEQSFYKKSQLFESINLVKKYPEEQIYYCLSQLIDNKNEYLIDRYGRRGYLINRGEYYAFQPIEITDENASIFERDVPVDYKRDSMILELQKGEVITETIKPVDVNRVELTGDDKDVIEIKPDARSYDIIFKELETTLNVALNSKTIETGDTDWFNHISQVLDILNSVHKIPLENVTKYIIYHYLDCLTLVDRLTIINWLYSIEFDNEKEKAVEVIIRNYFEDKIVTNKTSRAIVLADMKIIKIYLLKEGKWVEARQVDREKFTVQLNEKFIVNKTSINTFLGFMSVFKNQNIMFKTKDLSQTRNNIGAVCSQSGKADIIKRLNAVLEENIYYIKKTDAILKIGMCGILEIILRHFTETNFKGRGRIYFMDTERALLNKVSDL